MTRKHVKVKWAYGVTTCLARLDDLLPRTLKSLAGAGFSEPRIFIDGAKSFPPSLRQYAVTIRDTPVRTAGHWALSAAELYLRFPGAELYAIFQDDFVTYKNLRQYLEACPYPPRAYLNLYCFPQNEGRKGWHLSNQLGKGAVALVFSNEALRTLFKQSYFVDRPLDATRGHKAIDGGIVESMKKAGFQEWVHSPSLVQHTGLHSSMGNPRQQLAESFRGENFDAMELLSEENTVTRGKPIVVKTPAVHSQRQTKRIGLVGFNCRTGLGELNRQIATYAEIDVWLVRPHPKLGVLEPHDNTETMICPNGNIRRIQQFLRMVDTVLFAETPYYSTLIKLAKAQGKRLVCVPMLEWMPPGAQGWPKDVDLFICPTRQCYDDFYETIPCIHFPWPVDTERFKFRQRMKCERFLFLGGHGGFGGRKGEEVIVKTVGLFPEILLVWRTQTKGSHIGFSKVQSELPNNADLYSEGDVLLAPHSVDGLGLEPMEAMASGLPVVTTDGKPWNEIPAIARIEATSNVRKVNRPVTWYEPSAEKLSETVRMLLGQDISQASLDARAWAESRSWRDKAKEFTELVRNGEAKH